MIEENFEKKDNTGSRLKQVLAERNLRHIDVINLAIPYCEKYGVKISKSDISQYCSGMTEPKPDKLFVLAQALNVNEAWLMGFDVPMESKVVSDTVNHAYYQITLAEYEELIDVRTRMEILTEYRQRGLRPDEALLDILCGIQKEGQEKCQ